MSTLTSVIEQPASISRQRGCLFYAKRGLLTVALIIVALPVLGFVYEQVAEANDRQTYPPPGQRIDVGGYSLHLYCLGEGSPTVILDAGGGFTASSWAWVQPEVAQTTRACAYDRAGWGWSDPSPVGYDALQNAAELRLLLANGGVEPPYVLVGHSLGGLYDRICAQQYPQDVAGLVQVDASHPDAWRRMGLREGAGVDPQMLAIGPLAARLGLLRLMDVTSADSEMSGQLPEHDEGAMRAFLTTVQFAESAQAFDAALPGILEQARSITSLGDLPLVVLTTGDQADFSPDENRMLHEMQHELLGLSTNSVYIAEDGANHVSVVHSREHAQTAIEAIRQMIVAVRTGAPLTQ
jgi:pimeloyl-ACP methyl ester carboxylesterase